MTVGALFKWTLIVDSQKGLQTNKETQTINTKSIGHTIYTCELTDAEVNACYSTMYQVNEIARGDKIEMAENLLLYDSFEPQFHYNFISSNNYR